MTIYHISGVRAPGRYVLVYGVGRLDICPLPTCIILYSTDDGGLNIFRASDIIIRYYKNPALQGYRLPPKG